MTFVRLYDFSSEMNAYPVRLEGVLDREAMRLSSQDELYYVASELDTEVSLGHIKQYRVPSGGLYGETRWVTEIRYANSLNFCWRRYVCCKELMHVFDNADEQVNTPARFNQLVAEFEAPLPVPTPPMQSEVKTMWMALACLCPRPVRERFYPVWRDKEESDYEIALKLRIPEVLIPAIMSDAYEEILATL